MASAFIPGQFISLLTSSAVRAIAVANNTPVLASRAQPLTAASKKRDPFAQMHV